MKNNWQNKILISAVALAGLTLTGGVTTEAKAATNLQPTTTHNSSTPQEGLQQAQAQLNAARSAAATAQANLDAANGRVNQASQAVAKQQENVNAAQAAVNSRSAAVTFASANVVKASAAASAATPAKIDAASSAAQSQQSKVDNDITGVTKAGDAVSTANNAVSSASLAASTAGTALDRQSAAVETAQKNLKTAEDNLADNNAAAAKRDLDQAQAVVQSDQQTLNSASQAAATNLASQSAASAALLAAQQQQGVAKDRLAAAERAQSLAQSEFKHAQGAVVLAQKDVKAKQDALDDLNHHGLSKEQLQHQLSEAKAKVAIDQKAVADQSAAVDRANDALRKHSQKWTTAQGQEQAAKRSLDAKQTAANAAATQVAAAQAKLDQINQQLNNGAAVTTGTIKVPAGYTANSVAAARGTAFNAVTFPALRDNSYVSDPAAAAESFDISNISADQLRRLNVFAVNLINQVREQLHQSDLALTPETITIAKKIAAGYQAKAESLMNGHSHDHALLDQYHAGENIAAGEYPVNIGSNPHLANMPAGAYYQFVLQGKGFIPMFGVTTFDDAKALVYYGVCSLFFNDASSRWGHAQNFINHPFTRIGMAPSVLKTDVALTYSDGSVVHTPMYYYDWHFILQNSTDTKGAIPTKSTGDQSALKDQQSAAQVALNTAKESQQRAASELQTAQDAFDDAKTNTATQRQAVQTASNTADAAEKQLDQLKEQLATDIEKQLAVQTALDHFTDQASAVTAAQRALQAAQQNLSVKQTAYQNAYQKAVGQDAAVTAARDELKQANNQLTTAQTSLDSANTALDQAREQLKDVKDQLANDKAALTTAQQNYQAANATQPAKEAAVTAAQNALRTAQAKFKQLQEDHNAKQAALQSARNDLRNKGQALDDSQSQLKADQVKLQKDQEHLDSLQNATRNLAAAEAGLQTQQAAFRQAQTKLNQAKALLKALNEAYLTAQRSADQAQNAFASANNALREAQEDYNSMALHESQPNPGSGHGSLVVKPSNNQAGSTKQDSNNQATSTVQNKIQPQTSDQTQPNMVTTKAPQVETDKNDHNAKSTENLQSSTGRHTKAGLNLTTNQLKNADRTTQSQGRIIRSSTLYGAPSVNVSQNKLPQTGNSHNLLALLGMSLAGMATLLGFSKGKERD